MNNLDIKGFAGFFLSWALSLGYPGIIFLMILESCAVPIPSEIVLGVSGFLSGEGKINFYLVILSATIGTLIGSSILYYIGKKGGRLFLLKYGKYLLVNKNDVEKTEKWFDKYGSPAVLIGVLLPVIKTYIGFPAGTSLMKYKRFAVYTVVGSLIYNSVVVYLGLVLGKNIKNLAPYFRNFGLLITSGFAVIIALYLYRHIKALKK